MFPPIEVAVIVVPVVVVVIAVVDVVVVVGSCSSCSAIGCGNGSALTPPLSTPLALGNCR